MSDTVIKVEGLSKLYCIGHREEYHTLRDTIAKSFSKSLRLFKRSSSLGNSQLSALSSSSRESLSALSSPLSADTIWALKDVSFSIKRGEVVGIIGRNGAGKSTLLKILSRITEPTEGHAEIRGRVGSLLEVGTGFHPELSGRENIYLNGAILGMKKVEIAHKFDEIVAFAEVEKFIDTPVKHYSSGMYVRLAFAVAAHLEPEILLVDEVLAVGDAAFQKKCLGKMGDVAKEGRTVLFVSHNMAAVLGLCERAILLDLGRAIIDGYSREVVDQYLQTIDQKANLSLNERADREGTQILKFTSFELRNSKGSAISFVRSGQDIIIALKYRSNDNLRNVHVAIGVHGKFAENLFHLSTSTNGSDFDEIPPNGMVFCKVPRMPLLPGRYSFNLFCTVGGEIADWIQNAGLVEVEAGDFFGSGRLPPADQGPFMVQHSWGVSSTRDSAFVEE
jgi:lipopolysaccharide transport system ATP-binding protein